jgi:hypothetical protein
MVNATGLVEIPLDGVCITQQLASLARKMNELGLSGNKIVVVKTGVDVFLDRIYIAVSTIPIDWDRITSKVEESNEQENKTLSLP